MQQKNNSAVIGIIAVVIIGALVGGTILLKPKDSSTESNNSSASSSSSSSTTNGDTPVSSDTFKDGTYNANGRYSSPGGNEEIAISITITNGKVTDTNATAQAASNESREYQDEFVNGYKDLVVGKSIANLSLSKVSGSSLTSRGFNEALEIIKSQAKV